MTQLIVNIENAADASLIRKLLSKIEGVTVSSASKTRKSGLEVALDDVKAGRVTKYDSVDSFFKEMGY